jgi:hypothetical protein
MRPSIVAIRALALSLMPALGLAQVDQDEPRIGSGDLARVLDVWWTPGDLASLNVVGSPVR